MTDIRSLSMCLAIARLAIEAGVVTSRVDCMRLVRSTPWGRHVPFATLWRALRDPKSSSPRAALLPL